MFKTAIILIAVLSTPALVHADTIVVPDDYPTIQAAIDASTNGDTVLVKPGTYVENINFKGKAITVTSSDGPEKTIIDGGNPINPDVGTVVRFQSGEGLDTVLEGFSVINGTGQPYAFWGRMAGGVYCYAASPTIRGNIIKHNVLSRVQTGYGGGIYCLNSAALISQNIITENHSEQCAYQEGKGLFLHDCNSLILENNTISNNTGNDYDSGAIDIHGSDITIIRNEITENTGAGFGYGLIISGNSNIVMNENVISGFDGWGVFAGGSILSMERNTVSRNNSGGIYGYMYCTLALMGNIVSGNNGTGILSSGGCTGNIIGNFIIDNWALEHGGGIKTSHTPDTKIANNIIVGNRTENWGGGIMCEESVCTLVNNTIVGNSARRGGGVTFGLGSDSQEITNTILWENHADLGPEIYLGPGSSANLSIRYSDVCGGQASAFAETGSTIVWGPGVIEVDPLFVDMVNDFHLTYPSPCRDTGDNSVVTDLYDFEGNPRIAWGGTVDMGADEFCNHLYVTGDKTPGGSIERKIVGLPGTDPVGLLVSTSVLSSPMSTMWGEFWLQEPWYVFGPLGVIPVDGIMVLPTTLPTGMTVPVDVPMQALIGLNPDSLTNLYVLKVR